MPAKVTPIDASNVKQRIRDWLDNFNLTVKSVNDAEAHFLFIVTTEGGKKISIVRTKGQFSDYVEVRGLITAGDVEHSELENFSADEKLMANLAIQLELSRAVMGYRTEKGFLEDLVIFKRIPITSSLNEEELFGLMWEVEAMLQTIFIVGMTAVHRHKRNAEDKQTKQ